MVLTFILVCFCNAALQRVSCPSVSRTHQTSIPVLLQRDLSQLVAHSGVSAWQEWCSLERALGPNTMQLLSKVPKNSPCTPRNIIIQPDVCEMRVVVCGSGLFQQEADFFLEEFARSVLQACRATSPSGAPR